MDIARDKEMYLESCETSMTGFFAKTVNVFQPSTMFAKRFHRKYLAKS